jgi:hypothetical protein
MSGSSLDRAGTLFTHAPRRFILGHGDRTPGERAARPPVHDAAELGDLQRREFHEALLEAATVEDLPGKRQTAILKQSRTGHRCGSSRATRPLFRQDQHHRALVLPPDRIA